MTSAHWHLVLNHLPVFGVLFGTIIFAVGLIWKQSNFQKMAYVVFIVSALFTIPAYLTGEGAEEMLEEMGNVNHHLIHEHEELAETAYLMSSVLGVLSLLNLLLQIRKPERVRLFTKIMILLLGVFTFLIMSLAAYEGGKIRRPELQNQVNYKPQNEIHLN